METKTEAPQAKRHRSPSYPSIDLETAVEKVAMLYGDIRKNPAHIEAAVESMDYTPGSSATLRAIAAMINYGLVEEEGAGSQRTLRLTKPALDLQHLTKDDPDRLSILQQMALRPKIFEEIFNYYPGQLPNDTTIEKYLKITRGFNPDAVRLLIRNFRSTYQYANLTSLGMLSLSEEEDEEETRQATLDFQEYQQKPSGIGQQRQPPSADVLKQTEGRNVKMNNQEEMRTLTIPLPGERMAFLEVPSHSSAADFRFMQKYLELMQDAWIGHPDLRESARKAPKIRFGPATWHSQETDSLVTVVGYWGELDGRHYVEIEGSNTGVPFDEIEYDV